MWECKGSEECNPVSKITLKITQGIGFDVLQYDPDFPFINKEDTLDSYLSRYNKDKWEISKDLEPHIGDTIIVAYKNRVNGKLLGEAGVNAATIINNQMQMPFMKGGMSPLQGIVTYREVLQAGYCLEYIIRPKNFSNFKPIENIRELIKVLR